MPNADARRRPSKPDPSLIRVRTERVNVPRQCRSPFSTLSLGLCEDFLLALVQRLDLLIDAFNAFDKGAMRSPGIPAVFVMRPPLQEAHTYAAKVHGHLVLGPPEIRGLAPSTLTPVFET